MNAGAKKWRADKEFESQGRGKAKTACEERNYAEKMLREEIEGDEQASDDARYLSNTFRYIKAVHELRAEDPSRVYDDMCLKALWGRDFMLSQRAYDAQINKGLREKHLCDEEAKRAVTNAPRVLPGRGLSRSNESPQRRRCLLLNI